MRRLLLSLLLAAPAPAEAHDWLSGKTDERGWPCCYATEQNGRAPDCRITEARPDATGWLFADPWEARWWHVEDERVRPSEDGLFWLCRYRMEVPPRCFFGPKAGT